ncbi:MAG: hypothetical protein J6J36_06485 [Clostridia bacterium]|nr:hypothetical protein [Clostridia bacterium]
MAKKVKFGIGFVTGRPNVCRIVNSYYKDILEQVKRYKKEVEVTIFILFDTSYQQGKRKEFYNILPEVYKNIDIKYITPEDIGEEVKMLVARQNMDIDDMNFFFGHGHAKGRNTLMYYAIKNSMDYLLFWDDDEYPVAVLEEKDKKKWIKQDNILKHLNYMDEEKADVTIGYHCGYISPIPYIDYTDDFNEQDMKDFIEAISNDIISWESIREKMVKNNGVTFADPNIASGNDAYEINSIGAGKWVAGSTLCLNLNNEDKIPAFYNPPLARGEDTFFSTLLGNSKTVRIPVYHFHDGFLKYTEIMEGKYPKTLRKINVREEKVKSRFLSATMGWIKYKPLLLYISDKESYRQKIEEMNAKLEETIPKLNKVFADDCFTQLIKELEEYDKNVETHYEEYKRTNEIWKRLRGLIF